MKKDNTEKVFQGTITVVRKTFLLKAIVLGISREICSKTFIKKTFVLETFVRDICSRHLLETFVVDIC
jgi:hypothetical protein